MSDDDLVVGVLAASPSELPIMRQTGLILEKFDIPHEVRIMSSSRNPDLVDEYARHVGHVDLFREATDGLVGEAPPASAN